MGARGRSLTDETMSGNSRQGCLNVSSSGLTSGILAKLHWEIMTMIQSKTVWCRVLLLTILGTVLVSATVYAATSDEEEEAEGFVRSVAATVYGLAWPTAIYESFTFRSMDPAPNGYDIKVKLEGKSSFGGGDLWMEIVLELRNGTLNDVRVDRHNALLAPPFATAQAVGELVAELAEESFGDQQPAYQPPAQLAQEQTGGSRGFPFLVSNNCRHPVRIAIHYRQLNGDWQSGAWWNLDAGESSYLASGGARVLTDNSIFYYYAEAQDGSFYWSGGDTEIRVSGRDLPMIKATDDEGDTEISLSCPGR